MKNFCHNFSILMIHYAPKSIGFGQIKLELRERERDHLDLNTGGVES